jgi:LPXTG-site transpeptidase (sortase) family protein
MRDVDMQARLVWKGDLARSRQSARSSARAVEWVLLLTGLVALDVFIWANTSTVLYQAYEDWSFDEALRGLKPSVRGFVSDEISSRFGSKSKAENPELPRKFEPTPDERPPLPKMLLGRLRIPRLSVAAMVREGADSGTLRSAVGHIPGTALPGKTGNIGLAGHRDTFFRALRNIEKNDTIEFETESGTYRYAVESTKIVGPRDVSVLTAAGGRTLTLVTCYPFYYVGSAPQRFIVRAVQVGAGASRQQAFTPGAAAPPG